MEQKVRMAVGQVRWAVWLNSEEVRKVNPKFTTKSQWVRDHDKTIPLFDSPEQALNWVQSWIKDPDYIRFYDAKEFSREVINA